MKKVLPLFLLIGLFLLPIPTSTPALFTQVAYAQTAEEAAESTTEDNEAAPNALGANCGELGLPGCEIATDEGGNVVADVLSTVFFIVGFLSVLFIVVGAFRFVISAGDPQQAAQARNTILYAVIGLVISMFAWGILRFVEGALF